MLSVLANSMSALIPTQTPVPVTVVGCDLERWYEGDYQRALDSCNLFATTALGLKPDFIMRSTRPFDVCISDEAGQVGRRPRVLSPLHFYC